tara:strand:- start:1965 stop:2873 length:909 start_codon:yes stop_codon:yes gene_type:complete
MFKRIIIFFRPLIYLIKLFFYSPKYFFKKIGSDLKKDINSKKLNKKFHIVWCAGLPKSGTSLIEEILNELPLVQANNSFLRFYNDKNLDHVHGISEEMFDGFPKNKLTFLKTHTHFSDNYIKVANKYNAKIIISLRDIRDVSISRYHHVLNDKKDLIHEKIKNLKFSEGFIKSALEHGLPPENPMPIVYSYRWVEKWLSYTKNNNCLVLWFEEFNNNPEKYIKKIVDYLEFDNIDIDKIYNTIKEKQKLLKKNGLKKNLSLFEPKTFNKGTSGEWKKVLDKETLEKFYSILPGDISKVEYKN